MAESESLVRGGGFKEGLKKYLSDSQLSALARAHVGIAGAGGLGSNIAMLLARSGLERLTIIDHDVVEGSNLNRQHYWPRHLGQKKALALKDLLLELNPRMSVDCHCVYLDEASLPPLLKDCGIWAEAFDSAAAKAFFVEQALLAGRQVISASGICGVGGPPLARRIMGGLTLVGDFHTDLCMAPPMAPRVTQAAAIMADRALELILGKV